MTELPTLLVRLTNPETGAVQWKPQHGGRWKKAKSVYDASKQADAVMPAPRWIDYVENEK